MSFNPKNVIKIGAFSKTETGKIELAINEFDRGGASLDIRRWYKSKNDTEFKPGKGVSIPVQDIPKLKRAIAAAEEKAKKAGLL